MQAATTDDLYTFELVQSDGVTPISMTGYSSVVIAIQDPLGNMVPYTATVVGNDAEISTTPSTFPTGGNYKIQAIVSYTSGKVAKSRVIIETILPSID